MRHLINENIKKLFINDFISMLDIKEKYNKIDAMHNLLNNHKLTLKNLVNFKKLKYLIIIKNC